MTDKTLSRHLRELRLSLRLSQLEMAKKLELGEKMYQLYESGKYDTTGTETVKRQKLLDKIQELKTKKPPDENGNKSATEQPAPSELQKEIANLHEIILIKDKIIDAQAQALRMAEQLLLKNQKSLARVAEPKKN